MKKTLTLLCLSATLFSARAGKDPLGFTENKGQIIDRNKQLHPEVQFKLELPGINAYFKPDGIVYHFYRSENKQRADYSKADLENYNRGDLNAIGKKVYYFRLDLDLLNANPKAESSASNPLGQVSNYYLGHCPQGILGVKNFEEITYRDVYPGIDMRYYFRDDKLKYEFIVHPGADAANIKFLYKGARSVNLEDRRLKIVSDYNTIIEDQPYTYYQETGEEVKTDFRLRNGNVSFGIASYDHSKTLVIDPTITWASYYSNAYSSDFHANSAFDANGNIYVAYATYGSTWPTINAGAGQYYDATKDGITDLVVARINSNYSKQWTTYYGGDGGDYLCGTGGDYGKTLGVDASNNVYFGGYANGATVFPTQSSGVGGAFYQDQTKLYGGDTPFLVKLDANGVRQWATMFQHEQANTNSAGMRINGICVSGTKVYFTGETYKFNNNNIPLRTLAGAYNNSTFLGAQDPFIGRFSSNCELEWCTYFNSGVAGQQAYKQGSDITVDASGNLIYAGQASSGSATSGYLLNPGGGAYYSGTFAGSYDLHIAKFNASMQPVWATYYGSTDLDRISEVSTDASGNILIACRTIGGPGLPTVNPGGAFYYAAKQSPGTWSSPGSQDGGIMKFSPSGALTWATYVGGTNNNTSSITGISADNAGNIYAIGYTNTSNFPVINLAGAYNQAASGGSMDMVLMKFSSGGAGLWSTYYGGSGNESCYGIKIQPSTISNGCGYKQFNSLATASTNMPTFNPGGSAFYESSPATANSNALILLEEPSGSGNSTASTGVSTTTTTVCSGSSATLTVNGGSLGSGASWQWYTAGCGTTAAGTGTSITVSPSSATTYYVRAEGTCNTTACSSVTINMNTVSSAPTSINATSTTLCAGTSATLSINGGSLGTAANWQWYSGSCGGTAAGTGNSIVVSPGSTTVYYARAEGSCGNTACVSTTVNVNSVSSAPAGISAASTTLCAGANATLTVSGGSLGAGAAWQWFSGSCTGTAAGTGSSITVSPASTTTYFVKAVGSCNTTTCSSVTLNVNSNSTPATSANTTTTSICSGGTATLSANGGSLGTAASWQWYTGSCGGTLAGSGTSISVSPASTTVYYLRAEGSCGNTSCVTTTINVNTLSIAPGSVSASSNPVCAGNSTTLTANGGSLGTGATWEWFSGGCAGTPAGSGSSIVVSPSSSTGYFVKAVGICNTTTCSGLMVNTNAASTAASSINTTTTGLCSGGTATLSVNGGSLGTAANWQWYTGSCGGTLVGSGASISVSPSSTTVYYLRAEGTCGNTGCVSTTVTVNSVSSAPASVSASGSSTLCAGSSSTLTVNGGSLGTGANWQWFSGSCTGTAAGTGSSITVSPSSATTYFVKAVGSCNTTGCSSITVNVNAVSTAPASANPSAGAICSGNSSTLTVSGGSLGTGGTWHWYASGCGASAVGTGTSIVVSPGISTAYFVRAEDLCGNSLCAQVTVTVTPTPSAAWTSPGTVCSGSGNVNLSALVTGNTGGTWSGTGVSGSSFNPASLTGQSIPVTYSVANGSCTASFTQSISVAASVSAAWTSPGTLCASNGTVDLVTYLTGSTGGTWSGSGVSGTIFDPSALTGNIAVTYSVGSGSCSDVKTYTINVSPAASANWTSPGTLCASSGTVNLAAYLTGTGGGTWTGTGVSGSTFDPSTLAGQTILIGYQVGTNPCIASQSHTIQVVNVANASFTVPATVCENAAAMNLNNAVTGNTGGVFSGTGVSGNMFNPAGLAGQSIVITYSVGTMPCAASQTRTVTVSASPVAPSVAVSNSVICAGQSANITASGSGTGAVYTVYSSPGATGAVGATPLSVSPAVTTTYYVQSVVNGCSNLGGDVPFTINVNPLPVVNAGADQTVCLGSNVILSASGGGSYSWNTGATTSSITVTPTVNTSYSVTVTNANNCTAGDAVTVNVITGVNVQAADDAASVQNNASATVNVATNDTGDPNTVVIISGPYHGSATMGTNGTVIYTPSATFVGVDTLRYRICDATCSMSCREAKLLITVTKETVIIVPGGFSPNGDGNNDGFVIKGLELYPDNELLIINRWGDEVYKAAPYRNDWAGQSQGKGLTLYGNELVEGTYFYILTLDKNTPPMKGYVELKRK